MKATETWESFTEERALHWNLKEWGESIFRIPSQKVHIYIWAFILYIYIHIYVYTHTHIYIYTHAHWQDGDGQKHG